MTHLPEVAIDGDARFPELHVLVYVGGVSGTTLDFEGDQSVDIDLSVTPLSGNPMGWVLADDLALHNGAFGLEVLADAGDISVPCSLGTTGLGWVKRMRRDFMIMILFLINNFEVMYHDEFP